MADEEEDMQHVFPLIPVALATAQQARPPRPPPPPPPPHLLCSSPSRAMRMPAGIISAQPCHSQLIFCFFRSIALDIVYDFSSFLERNSDAASHNPQILATHIKVPPPHLAFTTGLPFY